MCVAISEQARCLLFMTIFTFVIDKRKFANGDNASPIYFVHSHSRSLPTRCGIYVSVFLSDASSHLMEPSKYFKYVFIFIFCELVLFNIEFIKLGACKTISSRCSIPHMIYERQSHGVCAEPTVILLNDSLAENSACYILITMINWSVMCGYRPIC